MGLGTLGRAISDVDFLARMGALVTVTDLKSADTLRDSINKLAAHRNITYHLGGHREYDFVNTDMVLRAPDAPLDSPYIVTAIKHGVPVKVSAALFSELAGDSIMVIGITGTRGKSTTATLIYHILSARRAGRVLLGGNVRGGEGLALLGKVRDGDTVVLELDSWQLQGFGDSRLSPHIAIFTTFMQDHMNYYRGDMKRYFSDKANIFRYQNERDVLIVGPSAEVAIEKYYGADIRSRVVSADARDLPKDWNLRILGTHNRDNAALAMRACELLGVMEPQLRSGIESFTGIEGRLQFVGEQCGVKIYNDNNATTPDATVAGLRALGLASRNIILIMGGTDKGLHMDGLLAEIPRYCRAVVAYAGTGTDTIRAALGAIGNGLVVRDARSLGEAVSIAREIGNSGDSILFSPAFASFGTEFKNEYDRNDQFMALVKTT